MSQFLLPLARPRAAKGARIKEAVTVRKRTVEDAGPYGMVVAFVWRQRRYAPSRPKRNPSRTPPSFRRRSQEVEGVQKGEEELSASELVPPPPFRTPSAQNARGQHERLPLISGTSCRS